MTQLNNDKRNIVILFALGFVAALACNVIFAGLSSGPEDDSPTADALMYVGYAQELAKGNGYSWEGKPTAFRMPGTSLALVPAFWAFGADNYPAARILICLVVGLSISVFYCYLREMSFSAFLSFCGAAGLACLPEYISWSATFLSEPIFTAYLIFFMFFLTRWEKSSNLAALILAGLFLGALTLVKAVGILLLLSLVGVYILLRKKDFILSISVLCLGLVVILSPWVLRNYNTFGHATLATNSGSTFWGANNEVLLKSEKDIGHWIETVDLPGRDLVEAQPDEYSHNKKEWELGINFVRSHLSEMPRLIFWKFYRLLSPLREVGNPILKWSLFLSWVILFPLSLYGMYRSFRDTEKWDTYAPLWAVILTLIAQTIIFYGSVRFRGSFAPVFVTFAVIAVQQFISASDTTSKKQAS